MVSERQGSVGGGHTKGEMNTIIVVLISFDARGGGGGAGRPTQPSPFPLRQPAPPPRLLLFLTLAAATLVATAAAPTTRPAGLVDTAHPGASPPPTPPCAALVAAAHTVTTPSGDITLSGEWQEFPCMGGVRARAFLTLRPVGGGGGSGAPSLDACVTVDAGFQIDSWAFDVTRVASVEEANACRPPYCQ